MVKKQSKNKTTYTYVIHNCGCEEKKCPDHKNIPICENCDQPANLVAVRSLCLDHENEATQSK